MSSPGDVCPWQEGRTRAASPGCVWVTTGAERKGQRERWQKPRAVTSAPGGVWDGIASGLGAATAALGRRRGFHNPEAELAGCPSSIHPSIPCCGPWKMSRTKHQTRPEKDKEHKTFPEKNKEHQNSSWARQRAPNTSWAGHRALKIFWAGLRAPKLILSRTESPKHLLSWRKSTKPSWAGERALKYLLSRPRPAGMCCCAPAAVPGNREWVTAGNPEMESSQGDNSKISSLDEGQDELQVLCPNRTQEFQENSEFQGSQWWQQQGQMETPKTPSDGEDRESLDS